MVAVIMAGGKGTRIASLREDIPKSMIPIAGKPVLEYQIRCLRRENITRIILVTGHLHAVIQEYFGDGSITGEDIHISYIVEETPLGTAGALYYLKDMMQEDFLLLNGDIIFDIDLARFCRAHEQNCKNGALATILTHPNQHPYDSAVVMADGQGQVTGWLNREDERTWYRNRVNAGIHMFSPRIFSWLSGKGMLREPVKLDLDRDVLKSMIPSGKLYVYDSPEYIKDMGTPQRCAQVEQDILAGRVGARSLEKKQRAVFLDRDGTINAYVGYLRRPSEFELLEGVAQAIRLLNQSGYLVIVVTNQPVIARGELTPVQLEMIHCKMETLLGREGAYVDAIYYCPHHPDRGFEGERPEYKVDCSCRKPKPGMLLEAAEKFHVDLKESWMVGDQETDIRAGENAGCHTAGLYGCGGERSFHDLLEFAGYLCGAGDETAPGPGQDTGT